MSAFQSSDSDEPDATGASRPLSSGKPLPARVHGAPSGPTDRNVERSAGGVVARILDGNPHLLLIRDPYRRWGLPKGHLEEGEGTAEAALREVREETGLDDLRLGPDLGEIDWTFRRKGHLVHKFCRFYLMLSARSDTQPELSEGITECKWLPVDEALRTIAYDNARVILRRGVDQLQESSWEGGSFERGD